MSIELPFKEFSFVAFPLAHGMDPSKFKSLGAGGKGKGKRKKNGSEMEVEEGEEEEEEGEEEECYDSTAFFVKEHVSGRGMEMLFFGDTEPGPFPFQFLSFVLFFLCIPVDFGDWCCGQIQFRNED